MLPVRDSDLRWLHHGAVVDWAAILSKSPRKLYSQYGEEGVIDQLFATLGTTNKFLVDIGAGDGFRFSNTRDLLEHGWTGALFDRTHQTDRVHREHITAENVCGILTKHDVPNAFDFLSIDIDGVDWYVLRALLGGGYRPRVFVCEINTDLPEYPPVTVGYDPEFKFSSCNYFGASLGAFEVLGAAHGFKCIYVHGINVFFVSEDLVSKPSKPTRKVSSPEVLPNPVRPQMKAVLAWGADPLNRPWYEIGYR